MPEFRSPAPPIESVPAVIVVGPGERLTAVRLSGAAALLSMTPVTCAPIGALIVMTPPAFVLRSVIVPVLLIEFVVTLIGLPAPEPLKAMLPVPLKPPLKVKELPAMVFVLLI